MAPYSYLLVAVLQAISIICFCGISLTGALNGGFSVELIHRDSAKSPLHNPTQTRFQQVFNAFHRSFRRFNHFYPRAIVSANAPRSEVTSNRGEYLMKYFIGTPPFEIMGIADTGSDLIWSQCKPCYQCYNQTAPMFDPSKSKTYQNIPCTHKICRDLDEGSCNFHEKPTCEYNVEYGDRSFSSGDVAFETLALGSTSGGTVSFPKIAIGCGHNNDGTFDSKGSGIVGLGGGAVSLVSQIGTSIDFKFSYCLVPLFLESKNASTLNFGKNALVSGSGAVSTPIITGKYPTFYSLILEGMSVGSKRLEFAGQPAATSGEGNIIIDSGTTLTFLPEDFYSRLESEVAARIHLKRVQDPTQTLSLCYRSPSQTIEAPIITAHFTGADIELNPLNTFVSVSDGVVCFAFTSVSGFGAIFGNIAQMNFLVGYDLKEKTVSFKPTDCTKM